MAVRVFRFLVVGGGVTLLAYLVFIWAIWAGTGYRLANLIAWICTVGVGATLNRRFTFQTDTAWHLWFPIYIGWAVVQLGVSALGYELLIGILGLRPTPAFIVNAGALAATNFLFLNFVAGRRARRA